VINPGRPFELIPIQQFGEFAAIPVNAGQIKRTEVLVERHVGQIVVNVKEEGVLNVLRGLLVRHPVQLVLNNFNRPAVRVRVRTLLVA